MLVREIMNRSIVTIKPEITLKEAAKVMSEARIGSLVVYSDGKILGIITSTDILKSVAREMDPNVTYAADVMTKDVKTIEPDKDVRDAVDVMAKYKIKKLPVISEGKLVGLITTSDIVSVEPRIIANLAQLMSVRAPIYSGG
jgi:CBS domain-containing protein